MQLQQQQPDISPYHRSELAEHQQNCPNCGLVFENDELQKITIRSIARTVRRNEQMQRKLLLQGEGNASPSNLMNVAMNEGQLPDEMQAVFSNTDTTWAILPPVLARLKRPTHQLFDPKSKMGDKDVRLCQTCYELFVDDEEQLFQANVLKQQVAKKLDGDTFGKRARKPTKGSALFCERKANLQKDMVFNPAQEQIRKNDRELHRKTNWRKRFIADQGKTGGEEDPIEWGMIPASATVLKEMKQYKHTHGLKGRGPAKNPRGTSAGSHSPQRIIQTANVYHPESQQGRLGSAGPKPLLLQSAPHGHAGAGALDIDWTTPQQQLVPTGAGGAGGVLAPLNPSDLWTPGEHHAQTEGELMEELQAGDHKTYFDASCSQRLCFELYSAMCQATRYGKACESTGGRQVEDILITDPFFTVYRRNQNRMPAPPISHLVTDAEAAVDGGAQDLGEVMKDVMMNTATGDENSSTSSKPTSPTTQGAKTSSKNHNAPPDNSTLTQLMHLLDEDVRFVERSQAFTKKTNRVLVGPGLEEEFTGSERLYLQALLAEPQGGQEGEGQDKLGGSNHNGKYGVMDGSGYRTGPGGSGDSQDDEEDEDDEEDIDIDDDDSVEFG